jgi:hypothetical protein
MHSGIFYIKHLQISDSEARIYHDHIHKNGCSHNNIFVGVPKYVRSFSHQTVPKRKERQRKMLGAGFI